MCFASIVIVISAMKEKDKDVTNYPVMGLVLDNRLCCGTSYSVMDNGIN